MVEIREFTQDDAAQLARLYKAADAIWPHGFANNVEAPIEDMLEEMTYERALNRYLAWVDDEVAGYADLYVQNPDEPVGYLGLLSGHPDYLGIGVGRDLILRVLARSIELKHERLTLGTWPGNKRAVPLYKKTGFFWGPDEEDLQNHMPTLLTHPLTKPYFDRVDWYKHYKRDLSLGFDTEKRNGALVFTYRWESPEGNLTAIFDQQSKRLTQLDTPELLLSLTNPEWQTVGDAATEFTLRVENRGERELNVMVAASGGDPISVDALKSAVLAPGAGETLKFEAKGSEQKSGTGALNLRLLIDGHELKMGHAHKVVTPVELTLASRTTTLHSGKPQTAIVNARNHLAERAELELTFTSESSLSVKPAIASLALEPGETRSVAVEVVSGASEAATLTVSGHYKAGDKQGDVVASKLQFVTCEPGQLVSATGSEQTALHSHRTSLEISPKGTGMKLKDRESGKALGNLEVEVGPPFWPTQLSKEKPETNVRLHDGKLEARLTQQVKDEKGLVLDRVVTLDADGNAALQVQFTNQSTESRKVGFAISVRGETGEDPATFPYEEGIVQGYAGHPAGSWVGASAKMPFAARWAAWEAHSQTFGVSWPEDLRAQGSWGSALNLAGPKPELGPGETWMSEPLTIAITREGWQELDRRWTEQGKASTNKQRVIPASGFTLAPAPLLMAGDEVQARIEARHYSPRPGKGEVKVEASEGFEIMPCEATFESLDNTHSASTAITVRKSVPRGVGRIEMIGNGPAVRDTNTFHAIAIGESGVPVNIIETKRDDGERLLTIDNGWMAFGVRPDVLGSVFYLQTPHGNALLTFFPEPAPLVWSYPVYGGITPVLWESGFNRGSNEIGRLHGLHMEAESCEYKGVQSVTWRGVKLTSPIKHESLEGLEFGIEYLTLSESNVLAIRTTISSHGPARRIRYGLEIHPAREPEHPWIRGADRLGPMLGADKRVGSLTGRRWATAEYPNSGTGLALVNSLGDEVGASEMWPDGVRLWASSERFIASDEGVSLLQFLIVTESPHQLEGYGQLSLLDRL